MLLTWEFVYSQVFRYYFLLYPGMSQIIPFNNQTAMENAAQALCDRVREPFKFVI